MRNKTLRPRETHEWEKQSDNTGAISPWPFDRLFEYIRSVNIVEILASFTDPSKESVDLRELCILTLFWYVYFDKARYSQIMHPEHHSSEYIFDKEDFRIIIQARQPDVDKDHWKAEHIHILIGSIDKDFSTTIIKPISKRHIAITNRGNYIQRRP